MSNEVIDENVPEKEVKKDFRDCLYGKIDVSVESVDKFIFGILVLLGFSILFGVIF